MASRRAVFLDRDGVLVRDVGPLTSERDIFLTPEAPAALAALKRAGLALIVVSNQTVVARGLLNELGVRQLQQLIEERLLEAGGPELDGFYFCPHHPRATDPRYRCVCACRKPAPGLVERAAREHGIDLSSSFMLGDRPSDIVAGRSAGCKTVQLLSGQHDEPPIEVQGGFVPAAPDFATPSFELASAVILRWAGQGELPRSAGGWS
jgi:D-glycero-D-manno-heptose 1,7-bisphosphate phosphatase